MIKTTERQLTFEDDRNANYLRDRGMRRSRDNADDKVDGWSETAFLFLKEYIQTQDKPFMAEDVRTSDQCGVPNPPNKRAWGAILVRAAREGLIKRIGFKETKNPWAHRTPASLWLRQ